MPSLRDIRKRVRSLKASQKITRAMQMVAAAKLRRAQERLAGAAPYVEGSLLAAGRLLGHLQQADVPAAQLPFGCQQRAEGRPILLLLGSDRGLCGPFNAQVLRWLERAWEVDEQPWTLVPVGRKVREPLARRPRAQLPMGALTLSTYDDCLGLAERLLALAEVAGGGAARPVRVVFNRFRSVISQVVAEAQLWPVAIPQPPAADGPRIGCLLEPDAASLARPLVLQAVAAGLWRALLNNQASEQGARMTAMDAATRNARDLMDELTLQYNRARQAAITRDLMDIVGGAEALAQG